MRLMEERALMRGSPSKGFCIRKGRPHFLSSCRKIGVGEIILVEFGRAKSVGLSANVQIVYKVCNHPAQRNVPNNMDLAEFPGDVGRVEEWRQMKSVSARCC